MAKKRSDWMRGLLSAERCIKEEGLGFARWVGYHGEARYMREFGEGWRDAVTHYESANVHPK